MVRIAHLTSVHPPFDVRVFHKECRTAAQAGYDVVLVVPHVRDETVDGVRVRAVPPPKGRLHRMLCTARQVVRAGLREKADIYHLHDPELLPWAQLLRLRKSKIIFDMHENMSGALLNKPWLGPNLGKIAAGIFPVLERVLLAGMEIVFAETSYQKHYQWVKRHTVVHNMPRAEVLLGIKQAKYAIPTLAYFGRVAQARGSLTTGRALQLLKQRGRQVNWECIGPGEESHMIALQRMVDIAELGGVGLRGYMPPAEGWRIVAACHIGLAVLMPTPNYLESYPTKLFEYMALGLPVIASDFPLYREVVEGNRCGVCVPPHNPEALASSIRWLLDNPDEAQAMGQRGRAAVCGRYRWDVEAEKLLAFYRSLVTQ